MKTKLKIFTCLFGLFFLTKTISAQQDAMYSMYMFNPMVINPAYAGSRDAMSFTALARRQWVSIPGAPATETFSFHTPTPNRRYGFGISAIHDKVSYINQTWLNVAYAFRIPMKKGTLALGLQGTLDNYNIDWNKAVLINANDAVVGTYGRKLFLPNAGTGAWYSTERFYAGFSIPHLLVTSLDKNRPSYSLFKVFNSNAVLTRHYFFTTGAVFPISEDVAFKPSVLFKYAHGGPAELDVNASFLFKKKFWVGASYRTGDGIYAILEYQISNNLRAGYAYDYPFTRLNTFTLGSHELMIGWDLNLKKDAAVSPRYF